MNMYFNNSKEIKATIRSIKRRDSVTIKDVYYLKDIDVYADYGLITIINNSIWYVSEKNIQELKEFYKYYYEIEGEDIKEPYYFDKGYNKSINKYTKIRLIECLTELLKIMQCIEKDTQHIQICQKYITIF